MKQPPLLPLKNVVVTEVQPLEDGTQKEYETRNGRKVEGVPDEAGATLAGKSVWIILHFLMRINVYGALALQVPWEEPAWCTYPA